MGEFNLDSGSFYTPQAYDISNIQGYTQSMGVKAAGCDEVRCTSPTCGVRHNSRRASALLTAGAVLPGVPRGRHEWLRQRLSGQGLRCRTRRVHECVCASQEGRSHACIVTFCP